MFVAYFVAPGDPAAELCRPGCPLWVLQEIRRNLGLNLPLWQQYFDYFVRIFHGNLGYSYGSSEPVTTSSSGPSRSISRSPSRPGSSG